jgi:hypothetical protein
MDTKEECEIDSGGDGGLNGDDFSIELPNEEEGAPLQLETIAASFEVDEEMKPQLTGVHIGAQIPGEQNDVLLFQWNGNEEEGWEDAEDDDEAPPPPEMIAASHEQLDGKFDGEKAKSPPESIEDGNERGIINNGAHVSMGNPVPSAPAILQSGPISIGTRTLQNDDRQGSPRSDRQDLYLEITTPPTPEQMPPSRPSFHRANQSLPILEATCVDDEVVYEAFPLGDTQDQNNARGWAKTPQKYRVIIIGLILVATVAITAVVVVVVRNQRLTAATSLTITASPLESPTVNLTMILPTSSPPSITPSAFPSTTTPSTSPTTAIPTRAPSIWVQQGPAIVGDSADYELGAAVAVSADARTIAIGAPGHYEDDSKTGYVKVYRTIDGSGNRVKLGDTIYGDATGDRSGKSVDITADGNTIVIGSPGWWGVDGIGDRPGYVKVFSLENVDYLGTNTWKQIGRDITGKEDGYEFGYSVSVSEDGKMIAVGAPYADGENGEMSGHVRIYRMDDFETEWVQIGDDIEGEAALDYSGCSVSLSTDGNKVAIGSYNGYDDNLDASGHVKVYQMDSVGSSWEPLGQTLYGDNLGDMFGWSTDLSHDGNTLAIGSTGKDQDGSWLGYVRVFSLEVDDDLGTNTWEQIGRDITSESNGDDFGYSVSLSNDGRTIVVGAPRNNGGNGFNSGHVRIYRMDDSQSDWIQIGDDIEGEAAHDWSGYSVSLSADGNKVAIGSPVNDDNGADAGHVRVYFLE